jgi:DNA invertase Pin-like site-specific DNA recombinase
MSQSMSLIGYARVSTDDQNALAQSDALKAAGCDQIFQEQASGGNRSRPVLSKVLDQIVAGDTLIVTRIDRLARSLSHLLEIIGVCSGWGQNDTVSPPV